MNQRSARENECEPFMGDESGQTNYEEGTYSDQQAGVQREGEAGARDHAIDQMITYEREEAIARGIRWGFWERVSAPCPVRRLAWE
jgi:hypothetical protein